VNPCCAANDVALIAATKTVSNKSLSLRENVCRMAVSRGEKYDAGDEKRDRVASRSRLRR